MGDLAIDRLQAVPYSCDCCARGASEIGFCPRLRSLGGSSWLSQAPLLGRVVLVRLV